MMSERKKEAKQAALRSLASRSQSSGMLREKLMRKGFEEEAVAFAIAEMVRLGYVDDAAYLVRVVEREIERGYGPRWIEMKLRRQGFERSEVEKAVRALYPRKRQEEVVARLKKSPAALVRRGFGWDLTLE